MLICATFIEVRIDGQTTFKLPFSFAKIYPVLSSLMWISWKGIETHHGLGELGISLGIEKAIHTTIFPIPL